MVLVGIFKNSEIPVLPPMHHKEIFNHMGWQLFMPSHMIKPGNTKKC